MPPPGPYSTSHLDKQRSGVIAARSQPLTKPAPNVPQLDVPASLRPGQELDPRGSASSERYISPRSQWHRQALPNPQRGGDEIYMAERVRLVPARDPQRRWRPVPPSIDAARLYPPMSPYDDPTGPSSAPEDLGRFRSSLSISTPAASCQPGFAARDNGLPRLSPTHSPASVRRTHSACQLGDATFNDDEDLRLFVAATSGMAPGGMGWQIEDERMSTSQRSRSQPNERLSVTDLSRGRVTSPTRTTSRTVHRSAQMLGGPGASPGLDLWTDASSAGMWMMSSEDLGQEPPSYEQSQSASVALQRALAADRAEELRRRWHAST